MLCPPGHQPDDRARRGPRPPRARPQTDPLAARRQARLLRPRDQGLQAHARARVDRHGRRDAEERDCALPAAVRDVLKGRNASVFPVLERKEEGEQLHRVLKNDF